MITTDPLAPLAARLGLAPGALYTLLVGGLLATVLTFSGPPAAFSTQTIVSPNSGLGNLAAPPPVDPTPAAAVTTTTTSTTTTSPAPPPVLDNTPVAPPPTTTTTTTTTVPAGPAFGDVVAETTVPGVVTAVETVAGGVVIAIDRDDADPRIVRLDDDGRTVGSIVVTDRDLAASPDIVDLAVDSDGSVLALVNGPPEVLRIGADGTVTSLGELGDLPPCGVPSPIALPIACEQDTADNAPRPVAVAVAGDRIVVSDVGQGVLWVLDGEGGVSAGSIDATYRAGDDTEGLRGLVGVAGGTVIASLDASLVEFTFGPDTVERATVLELDRPVLALDGAADGRLAVLHVDGDARLLDRSLAPLPTPDVADTDSVDLALGADGLWTARRGDPTSSLARFHLGGS